ncbi:MAG: flagellar motor stator protein MotA [Ignavibacteria bacterium]
MFIIIGSVVVIAGVLIGFMMAGGNPLLLLQWSEFITIGGATIGSLLITAPLSLIKKIIVAIPAAITYKSSHKSDYLELLKAFNDLFLVAQRDGLIAIEKHIENPDASDILSRNKRFINDGVAKSFFCDTMKVMLSGGVPPHEIEALLDTEIETFEMEQKPVAATLAKTGDALPGLGIVAAVLGIIVTMGAINDGPEKVGHHVAAALVGTFLGVLASYGFVGPLATNIEHNLEHAIRDLETIKACIVAYAKGNPPIIAVEIARRTIFSDHRPTFQELESYIRGK